MMFCAKQHTRTHAGREQFVEEGNKEATRSRRGRTTHIRAQKPRKHLKASPKPIGPPTCTSPDPTRAAGGRANLVETPKPESPSLEPQNRKPKPRPQAQA